MWQMYKEKWGRETHIYEGKKTVNPLCIASWCAHICVSMFMCDHVCVAIPPLRLFSYILIRAALSQ